MDKGRDTHLFHYVLKSGFIRSIFLRVLPIFMIVSVAIAAITFYSFAGEIRRNILSDRQRQLNAVEETISKRMEEINSIAYNIGKDSAFYLEPVEEGSASGYEMSNTLSRYLVGNSFIEHLAYYRLAEPDTLYISSGVRSMTEFFCRGLGLDESVAQEIIHHIQSAKHTEVSAITYGKPEDAFFAYLYPLPQLSANPQAFVLMMIPVKEVTPLLQTLLMNSSGEVAVFDDGGHEIYRVGMLDDNISLQDYAVSGEGEQKCTSDAGTVYVLQKAVSASNGWVYVSAIRQSDTLSGLANKQLVIVVILLLLLLVTIIAMLWSIVKQYKPISNLAAEVAGGTPEGGSFINEGEVLSSTIASLKDDSAQKQKFETAYHEAEAASRAKSTFLSNMSHDIRTPMNAVIGMTALALHHADDSAYVRECLQKVQTSSQYLLDIINNVLDMSRIESGRVTLTEEVVDLKALVGALSALLEPSVAAKSLHFQVETDRIGYSTVIGDGVRLTQVFVNILSNSVKFTPEGGTIKLSVQQTPSEDSSCGQYVFVCSDTGIGMSSQFVGQVFDVFSQAAEAGSTREEGTGLGMAIAKNLVELMGGHIRCDSVLGQGTTFTVMLPLRFASAEADNGALPHPKMQAPMTDGDGSGGDAVPDFAGRRILLVEDNAVNREIARRILSETGAEVLEAVNGQKAVALFDAQDVGAVDIILMDLQMPVMNGYEAAKVIRTMARSDAAKVPIYAMTANTFDEDVRRAREAGMNGHIGKPYTPAALYRILSQALKS